MDPTTIAFLEDLIRLSFKYDRRLVYAGCGSHRIEVEPLGTQRDVLSAFRDEQVFSWENGPQLRDESGAPSEERILEIGREFAPRPIEL